MTVSKNIRNPAFAYLANKNYFLRPTQILDFPEEIHTIFNGINRMVQPLGPDGPTIHAKSLEHIDKVSVYGEPSVPAAHAERAAEAVTERARAEEEAQQAVVEGAVAPPAPLPPGFFYIGFHLQSGDSSEPGYAMAPLETWQNSATWRYVAATIWDDYFNVYTGKTSKHLLRRYTRISGYTAGDLHPTVCGSSSAMPNADGKTLNFYVVVPAGSTEGIGLASSNEAITYTTPGWENGPSVDLIENIYHFSSFYQDPVTLIMSPTIGITPTVVELVDSYTPAILTRATVGGQPVSVRTFQQAAANMALSYSGWSYEASTRGPYRAGYYATCVGEVEFNREYPETISKSFCDPADVRRHGYVYVMRSRDNLRLEFSRRTRTNWELAYYSWYASDTTYVDGGMTYYRRYYYSLNPNDFGRFGCYIPNVLLYPQGVVAPHEYIAGTTNHGIIAPFPGGTLEPDAHYGAYGSLGYTLQEYSETGVLTAYLCFFDEEFEIDAVTYSDVPRVGPNPYYPSQLEYNDFYQTFPAYSLLPGGAVFIDMTMPNDSVVPHHFYSVVRVKNDHWFNPNDTHNWLGNFDHFGATTEFVADWLSKITFGVAKNDSATTGITNDIITLGEESVDSLTSFNGMRFNGHFTIFKGVEA